MSNFGIIDITNTIISKLIKMYKLECLSCNNLKHSDDVFRTKRTIKGTKRQNEYLYICFMFLLTIYVLYLHFK